MNNTVPIPAHELRLRKLPFITCLPYDLQVQATKLIQAGADEALLHFWHNVVNGCYKEFPASVLEVDIQRFKEHYPGFADQIDSWQIQTPLIK
jgi:hypothetical protein